MTGKALVTGAGRRLGRAMALWLGARGWDVAVHYASSAGQAQAVADEIAAHGQRSAALQADLLDDAQIAPLVDRAVQMLGGPLTLLINNASIFEQDSIATATRDSWDRHMMSNLRAPFVLTQRFAAQAPRAMADILGEPRAQAQIINIIDQKVWRLNPDFMSYTLAKSALWTLTRTAAQGLAPDVRVNAIGPGPTLRSIHQTAEDFARERAGTLLHRGASEADITAALGYLLEAPSVTGQMIAVDGGQHLGSAMPDVLKSA